MTTTTVTDFAVDSDYELGVRAVDGADDQSATATVAAVTDGEGTDGGGPPGRDGGNE